MKSIRAKIMLLLFCSVFIVSLILGAFGIVLTTDIIKQTSTENMQLLCKNNADKIDITLAKIEESINTLSHFIESELTDVNSLKNDAFRDEFSAEMQKNALHHIENINGAAAIYLHYDRTCIGKTDGFLYMRDETDSAFNYYDFSVVSPDETNAWWYIPDTQNSSPWVEAYKDDMLNRYVISYIIPIYKDEQLIAHIGADVFTEHIEEQVKGVSIYDSGKSAILKSDGTVLYHPNFAAGEYIGEGDPGFVGVIDKLTNGTNNDELISYELNGIKKKITSCKLRNGMLMVCFAPEAEIYHQQNVFMLTNIIITAIVVIIALIIAFLVSRALTNPIKNLNEASKQMIIGEFDYDIKSNSRDEIGELTNTFIETRKILKYQIHSLDKEAHVDGLTGVGNKSAFTDKEAEINFRISHGNLDFSVIVFDVNKLKIANDIFGHMAGDKLLLTVSNHLSSLFNPENVYRLGGDEFVVITEDTNIDKRLSECIEEMKSLSVEGYPECTVSCAYGASRFNKETDKSLSEVLHRADKEMYKNKTKTKKETFPWQKGSKGIKQLQIEKYCELLHSLKDSTDDYLFIINIETMLIRFFGGNYNNLEFIDIKNILPFVHPNEQAMVSETFNSIFNHDVETVNINFRMVNGDIVRWVNCRGNIIKDELDSHFVVIGRISQNAVKHLYNPITTLFNKTKLKTDLQGEVFDRFKYLMLIDIDNLSEINLKHGSLYGDNILKSLAETLENRFKMWQIYHAEKDIFAILLDVNSAEETATIFDEIKTTLSGKCTISGSIVPNDNTPYISSENIYDYAMQLLNKAKKNGNGNLELFTKESLLESISEVELLEELEASVRDNCRGFHLVYQPQINAEDYSIIAAESLLRFKSETKGQVFPDQFIPLLEQSGLINEVGIWVADKALKKCREWRNYIPDFKISVNLSPKQLEKKDTAQKIISLLAKHNVPGNALILEITESAQLDENEDVFSVISEFQQAGIEIAIDDFGTGYSNLGNLKHIHANILKVDRVFIKDIKENGYNYNLIYNVLEFAKSNALKVCLEGVETKEELLVLSGLQPHIFQGYFFDRPCSADLLEAKYFIKDSKEYTERIEAIEQLNKEKNHAPIVNMEMKTILQGLGIGLWIIRINKSTGEGELYADEIMRNLLGVDNNITPKECFKHWYKNIQEDCLPAIEKMLTEMGCSNKVVQVEYLWNHQEKGNLLIRSSGRCTANADETIVYEGFHRIINDLGNSL